MVVSPSEDMTGEGPPPYSGLGYLYIVPGQYCTGDKGEQIYVTSGSDVPDGFTCPVSFATPKPTYKTPADLEAAQLAGPSIPPTGAAASGTPRPTATPSSSSSSSAAPASPAPAGGGY